MSATEEKLLNRREVVAELLRDRGDLLVIAGLGAPNYDITAAGDSPASFPLWGAMGGAAMIGLGLALARPERRVLVVTGDGEMLMGLGALSTISVKRPRNLTVCVLDNERYGETGSQRTHTAFGVDLSGVAKAMGYGNSLTVRSRKEVEELRNLVRSGEGPIFASVKIDPAPLPIVLPPSDGVILTTRFRRNLLGEASTFN
jgi:thiamine pyrophosphate-dependent acetolactate synthase large subunit-like protein